MRFWFVSCARFLATVTVKKKCNQKETIYILVLSLQDRLQFRWDNKYMIVVVDIDIVVVVVVFLDLLSRAHPSLLRRYMDRWGPM